MTSPRKTRVAVVSGGRSSAGAVAGALDPAEFDVVPITITGDGQWTLPGGEPVSSAQALDGVDVVFPLLRGAVVQGLLEMAGLPYVGSGVLASAAAVDREFTRKLAAASGIPVVPYAVLRPGTTLTGADRSRLGLPVLVRPAGSSQGITTVKDWPELDAALAHARTLDPTVLVEAAIAAREIQCEVLEGGPGADPEVSVPADGESDLPEPIARLIRDHARAAFTAFDCAGLVRVTFLVTPDLDVYLSEIDTMPGLTPHSTGLDHPALVTRLVHTALHRGAGLH